MHPVWAVRETFSILRSISRRQCVTLVIAYFLTIPRTKHARTYGWLVGAPCTYRHVHGEIVLNTLSSGNNLVADSENVVLTWTLGAVLRKYLYVFPKCRFHGDETKIPKCKDSFLGIFRSLWETLIIQPRSELQSGLGLNAMLGNVMIGIHRGPERPLILNHVSLVSLSSPKTQLWGRLGHLHAASFQTCLTKRGRSTSGPYEIEYIPSR